MAEKCNTKKIEKYPRYNVKEIKEMIAHYWKAWDTLIKIEKEIKKILEANNDEISWKGGDMFAPVWFVQCCMEYTHKYLIYWFTHKGTIAIKKDGSVEYKLKKRRD